MNIHFFVNSADDTKSDGLLWAESEVDIHGRFQQRNGRKTSPQSGHRQQFATVYGYRESAASGLLEHMWSSLRQEEKKGNQLKVHGF
uniref:Uncharacterized protein n=1 Tax=Salvator merianae TaxID=96440 RepID=A0A8D0BX53_SALMN